MGLIIFHGILSIPHNIIMSLNNVVILLVTQEIINDINQLQMQRKLGNSKIDAPRYPTSWDRMLKIY